MSNIAIHAENLAKLYRIGQRDSHPTLRAAIVNSFHTTLRRLRSSYGTSRYQSDQLASGDRSHVMDINPPNVNSRLLTSTKQNSFATDHPGHIWALKDVSFEVKKGEILGIIGPNGSGKSTLLKLLAQITEPTQGEIHINGRVTALIELGAGFHPELTGRENIYLNGAILGLSKKEVDVRFEQIVDFAELWDFIDTPVKHYSSGMTVRLGFAVAVSVDPDILLVDEVLAVGDAAFHKRCFERIDAFVKARKTIIVVSHSLDAIRRLARRAILINHGTIKADGSPDEVITQYTSLINEKH